jgi:acetoin utilization deacetylase AcuC-like enzyme
MSAGLYYSHPACLEHDPRVHSPGHPDTPERLVTLEAALAARSWLGWERREAPAATEAELERVHDPGHVAAIRALCLAGGGAIDPDTYVGEASYRAALHAAGGASAMVRALLAGEGVAGFCGVRPSGHHAERDRAMGFCLFNNVAVAAATAIAELDVRRVLVLDWDVHAGNGTAEVFRRRADVLVACIHQAGLYPGTGPLSDAGSGEGEGYTINLPVPPGSGEAVWLTLLERIVLPAAARFEPQLVLVSAGFDAHAADPLASCRLQTGSFAKMAELVRALARGANAPVGLVLEGGYVGGVLAECVCATLPVFAGPQAPAGAEEPEREAGAGDAGEGGAGEPGEASDAQALLALCSRQVSRYWPL